MFDIMVFVLPFQCGNTTGWVVEIPAPAGRYTMRVVLRSTPVVLILTGVGFHRGTSTGVPFQFSLGL